MDLIENSKNEIQKQFANSNITMLIIEKAKVQQKYIASTVNNMISELIDWRTCSEEALDRWGMILQMPRIFKLADGTFYKVPVDEYRYFISVAFLRTNWQGDLYSANEALKNIYNSRGICQILDYCDMQFISYVMLFDMPAEVNYILTNYDILPKIAGLGIKIIVRDKYYFALKPYNRNIPKNVTTGMNDYEDDNIKVQQGKKTGTLSYYNEDE
jgi:hypothetical protein